MEQTAANSGSTGRNSHPALDQLRPVCPSEASEPTPHLVALVAVGHCADRLGTSKDGKPGDSVSWNDLYPVAIALKSNAAKDRRMGNFLMIDKPSGGSRIPEFSEADVLADPTLDAVFGDIDLTDPDLQGAFLACSALLQEL